MTLHIAIVGPIATENIARLLNGDTSNLPLGGAPHMATPIGDASATTTSLGAPSSPEKWLTAIKG